jgi:hypothetical protein
MHPDTKLKIRKIFLPFLYVNAGFTIIYSFFHWVLVLEMHWVSLREDIAKIVLPLALSWVPVLIWIRPNIKRLQLKVKKGNWLSFYLLISWYCVAGLAIIAQDYLTTATGKLTKLESVKEIYDHPASKYYSIQHHYIDKNFAEICKASTVTGKGKLRNLDIYVSCPLYDKNETPVIAPPVSVYSSVKENRPLVKDKKVTRIGVLPDTLITIKTMPATRAWVCLHYSTQISNNVNDAFIKKQWELFYETSMKELKNTDLNQFTYLDVIGNNRLREKYKMTCQINRWKEASPDPFIVEARFEPYDQRNGNMLTWLLLSLGVGAVIWLIMVLLLPLKNEVLRPVIQKSDS